MPKYKYVDGVKYRVVPQSVLGYALVREGTDNSLPSGGTEGQVLAKASDADYDVEWTTVESGGDIYYVDFTATDAEATSAITDTTMEDITEAISSGKTVTARVHVGNAYYILPMVEYISFNNLLIPFFNAVVKVYPPSNTCTDIINVRIEPLQNLTEWSFALNYWHVTTYTGSPT